MTELGAFSSKPHIVERRQVCVLFTDMVGYTATVESLDEEQALVFTQSVYDHLTGVVTAHGGTVRAFAGDSIMALFGIPEAQEDAALRACRTALAIQAEFTQASDKYFNTFGVKPVMRVGISSGTAMMAAVEGDGSPVTAIGTTVNLASRVQNLAPEGGCVICDATRRLVEWYVNLDDHGDHAIKGMSRPLRLWRLNAIHKEDKRFDASIAKGLSAFIGRDSEMKALNSAFTSSERGMGLVEIKAEPGLGKTRLVYEFLRQSHVRDTSILRGHCNPDGQKIPFLPFIEVVKRTFEISESDSRDVTIDKLTAGLKKVDAVSDENLSLLLNLLGRAPIDGALDGLDGVLIGLRTRNILMRLIEGQCANEKIILLIEDIHWIDKSSDAILERLVKDQTVKNLMIIATRRMHNSPSWNGEPSVTTLALQPLSDEQLSLLAQSWMGIDDVPSRLAEQLSERAGGNPLFGEELLGFLMEEGALSITDDKVEFDETTTQSAVPASMQSLLTSRVDRLDETDRAALQTASAMGRRFDPKLLALIIGNDSNITASLKRLEKQDLIYREPHSSDYLFKHAMLRETVYTGMITERRKELHAQIGAALEQKFKGRLSEAADRLAFHYSQTDKDNLAFKYAAMAGNKSLGIFSLSEANSYFATAFELYLDNPECASKDEFLAFVDDYALGLNISLESLALIDFSEQVLSMIEPWGDSRQHALLLFHYIQGLICNARYPDAYKVVEDLAQMSARLNDPFVETYALVSQVSLSSFHRPLPWEEYAKRREKIDHELPNIDDQNLHCFYQATIGFDEVSRGRVLQAHALIDRMMADGEARQDPRSTGFATALRALIAMLSDDHEGALHLSEEALKISRGQFEIAMAQTSRASALIPVHGVDAMDEVQQHLDHYEDKGVHLYLAGPEAMPGLGLALQGKIGEAISHVETAIARREAEGYQLAADWYRLFLCEIYLVVLSEGEKPELSTVLRNAGPLLKIMLTGSKQIKAMVRHVKANPIFEEEGHYIARCDLILGSLYKLQKKKELAITHLQAAHKIIAPFGQTPLLDRVETELSELGAL